MLAVLEIPQPSFQCWCIVFANGFAVRDDGGFTRNGGPFAAGIEEGNIDFGVVIEIVGLARFGVGVEEEVNAATFLVSPSVPFLLQNLSLSE